MSSTPDITFQITYQEITYRFPFGSQAYIFHTAIYNQFDARYGMDEALHFVDAVFDCYIADDNKTSLGALCDYVAENWDTVKDLARRDILAGFYDSL